MVLTPIQELAPAQAAQSLRVLVWDRDLTDLWSLDADGGRQPFRGLGSRWHLHPDLELTLIERGEGLLSVGDHIGRFAGPDCLLLGADVPHVWKSPAPIAGISLQFRLDAGALATVPELVALAPLWRRAARGLRWRGATAARLRELLGQLEGRSALARLARFLDILSLLRAAPERDAVALSRTVLAVGGEGPGAGLHQVLDHLMEHHDGELSLGEAVRMSGLSQATFCRRFVRLTGKTFTAYVNALRLQAVRRALAESDRSVTDIALGAGFASLTNFYDRFRREIGCTPREYRRRLNRR